MTQQPADARPLVPADRTGPYWDLLSGRVPLPKAAATLGSTLLRVDPERGEIELGFEARDDFANPIGNVQGGFLAAMLDEAVGMALGAVLEAGQFGVTLDINVSFLRPARPGRLTGHGRVLHRGGSVAFLAGELRDADGQLVATATSTSRIIRPAPGVLATASGNGAPDGARS